MNELFVYRTLEDPKVQEEVLGHTVTTRPGVVVGYKEVDEGSDYHSIVPSSGDRVEGLVLTLTDEELEKVDEWEDDYYRSMIMLEDHSIVYVYIYNKNKREADPMAPINLLVDALNKDLEFEYAAAIQYVNHSAMLKTAPYLHIAEELRKHADEEFGHAKILADLINYYGGIPSVGIEAVKTSDDNDGMLRLNLESEQTAISRYTERIKQATEADEFALVEKLQGIIADEQEHKLDLMTALGV